MHLKRLEYATPLLFVLFSLPCYAKNWPCWRGPTGDGISSESEIPTQWNCETGENVVWSVTLPGSGHSSPVIWGGRIFLTACVEEREERVVVCLDRRTGRRRWEDIIVRAPLENKQIKNSYASSTPATDGERVYVTFLEPDGTTQPIPWKSGELYTPGNMVVARYRLNGRLDWVVRPAKFTGINGYCSAPFLYDDKVIVNGDQDGVGFLVALDAKTGQTVWKINRSKNVRLGSFAIPIVRELGGRKQLLFAGNGSMVSFNPRNGSRYWIIDRESIQYVPSAVSDGQLVFMSGGHPKRELVAIRPDGEGNVTDTHIVWETGRAAPHISSPVVINKHVFTVSDAGVASCLDAATGERRWQKRLGESFYASIVANDEYVYYTSIEGVTKVVRAQPTFELVSENPLGERIYASPAVSNGQIFLRGMERFYCIGRRLGPTAGN